MYPAHLNVSCTPTEVTDCAAAVTITAKAALRFAFFSFSLFKNVTGFNITFWLLQTFDVNGFSSLKLYGITSNVPCSRWFAGIDHGFYIALCFPSPVSLGWTFYVNIIFDVVGYIRSIACCCVATFYLFRYALWIRFWETSKSAQHLLHLMRLMTIIDRSFEQHAAQSLQFEKFIVHLKWLVCARSSNFLFMISRFNEAATFHNQIVIDCLFQLFLLLLINWWFITDCRMLSSLVPYSSRTKQNKVKNTCNSALIAEAMAFSKMEKTASNFMWAINRMEYESIFPFIIQ